MTRAPLLTVLFVLIVSGAFTPIVSAHYRPGAGRWIERDPAEFIDGMNRYEYVGSRPVRYRDASGLHLVIDGPTDFRGHVMNCLKMICPDTLKATARPKKKGYFITNDVPAGGYEKTDLEKSRDKLRARGKPCPPPNPDCSKRPGCDVLDALINSTNTHFIREGVAKDVDFNEPLPNGDTVSTWTEDAEIEREESVQKQGHGKYFLSCEVLWHELIHSYHSATGTRDLRQTKPGEYGWEEVNTITKNNELRAWYNKCNKPREGSRDIPARDPYSHPWSKGLKPPTTQPSTP